jgi:hypothetical protein
LALALAPAGNLITANPDTINRDPSPFSEIVEFTPTGQSVSQFQMILWRVLLLVWLSN